MLDSPGSWMFFWECGSSERSEIFHKIKNLRKLVQNKIERRMLSNSVVELLPCNIKIVSGVSVELIDEVCVEKQSNETHHSTNQLKLKNFANMPRDGDDFQTNLFEEVGT